ncbi:MAG: hypothetical protein HY720_05265 [Planctomycetes bacterium]|nr:hypothetical protein [Planctomycetota bacterium]
MVRILAGMLVLAAGGLFLGLAPARAQDEDAYEDEASPWERSAAAPEEEKKKDLGAREERSERIRRLADRFRERLEDEDLPSSEADRSSRWFRRVREAAAGNAAARKAAYQEKVLTLRARFESEGLAAEEVEKRLEEAARWYEEWEKRVRGPRIDLPGPS